MIFDLITMSALFDLLITCNRIGQTYLISKKIWWGWVMALVTTFYWIFIFYVDNRYLLLPSSIIMAYLNIVSIYNWRFSKSAKEEINKDKQIKMLQGIKEIQTVKIDKLNEKINELILLNSRLNTARHE